MKSTRLLLAALFLAVTTAACASSVTAPDAIRGEDPFIGGSNGQDPFIGGSNGQDPFIGGSNG